MSTTNNEPNQSPPAKVDEQYIFFAPAEKYQIAGPEKEKRDGGKIIQSEGVTPFTGYLKITSDKKVAKFIRDSLGFQNGQITECATMDEANRLVAEAKQLKGIRTVKTGIDEMTAYVDKGAPRVPPKSGVTVETLPE